MDQDLPTYYLYRDIRGKFTAVFRFYEDRSPEVYHKGEGWVASDYLFEKKMSGEIDSSDIISEKEALDIIARKIEKNAFQIIKEDKNDE